MRAMWKPGLLLLGFCGEHTQETAGEGHGVNRQALRAAMLYALLLEHGRQQASLHTSEHRASSEYTHHTTRPALLRYTGAKQPCSGRI